ncbi:MAG: hypothetical protein GXP40_05720 [Chloroflexi bacterium]|nr:hypothetical protein [Chloroflexota bacterium]
MSLRQNNNIFPAWLTLKKRTKNGTRSMLQPPGAFGRQALPGRRAMAFGGFARENGRAKSKNRFYACHWRVFPVK